MIYPERPQASSAAIEPCVIPDHQLPDLEARMMASAGLDYLAISPNAWIPASDQPECGPVIAAISMIAGTLLERDSKYRDIQMFVTSDEEGALEGFMVGSDILGYDELETLRDRWVDDVNHLFETIDSPHRL